MDIEEQPKCPCEKLHLTLTRGAHLPSSSFRAAPGSRTLHHTAVTKIPAPGIQLVSGKTETEARLIQLGLCPLWSYRSPLYPPSLLPKISLAKPDLDNLWEK